MFAEIENNEHLNALASQASFEERCQAEQVYFNALSDAEDA